MASETNSMLTGWVGWLGWSQFIFGLVVLGGVLVQPNTAPYSDVVSHDLIAYKLTWAIAGAALTISGSVFAALAHFRR